MLKHVCLAVAAGACHADNWLQYEWDDRRVLCSQSIDDLTQSLDADFVDDQLAIADDHDSVALFHAHVPGVTISMTAIHGVLGAAQQRELAFVTYSELEPGTARGAVALCFDDSAVRAWHELRPTLRMYGARVTFFVTRYASWMPEERILLQELAADGHDVQPHTVNHLNAVDYAAAHGIDAYVQDEVAPSIAELEADGYAVTSFAFPFGKSSPELDDAVLEHVRRVRVSPGSCPY